MALDKRHITPAMQESSRRNSLHSSGPRSEHGKSVSSKNARKACPPSAMLSPQVLVPGESNEDFEGIHAQFEAALAPRDDFERAWVEDLAVLRYRLFRLRRSEAAKMAVRRREYQRQHRRASQPATGAAAIHQAQGVGLFGYDGLPDSAAKFSGALEALDLLRNLVQMRDFDQNTPGIFAVVYGQKPAPHATMMKCRLEVLMQLQAAGKLEADNSEGALLLAEIDQEMARYQKNQKIYEEEHAERDLIGEDAELLLPNDELDRVIRLEVHLEQQLERKLQQFYARRREATAYPRREEDDESSGSRVATPPPDSRPAETSESLAAGA